MQFVSLINNIENVLPGSLFAVPVLSTKLKVSDNVLAMIGSLSSVVDYLLYGMVSASTAFFMWIGKKTFFQFFLFKLGFIHAPK